MGSLKVRSFKSTSDRKAYLRQLFQDYDALEYMINHNWFETGIQRIGLEQEMCLVDHNMQPANKALDVLKQLNDEQFTTELALFNLELNLDPIELKSHCFNQLDFQLNHYLDKVKQTAGQLGVQVLLTGILPTLRKTDLTVKNITPFKRYLTLNRVIKDIKNRRFKLRIKGVDELIVKHDSILFEACNTSLQVHLQIGLDEIIDKYNWAQAIAGPVLSVMTNSPFLLGKELWSETRIALFQQSIDLRNSSHLSRDQKSRVFFGDDWLKDHVLNYYKDNLVRYVPILTSDFNETPSEQIHRNEIPKLQALNLFNGTLYKWNRLCYGISNGKPHFRIENRYIPSGPTIVDEIANTVFWIGLMQGMPKKYQSLYNKIPFEPVKSNFVKAARNGLNSYFNWFGEGISAKKLILEELIPLAKKGLLKSGLQSEEFEPYIQIIEERVKRHITGSIWQINCLRELKQEFTKDLANVHLTRAMLDFQAQSMPIHKWPTKIHENAIAKHSEDHQVSKFMTTEVFVVNQDDLVILAHKIIDWKELNHVPVVNQKNHVVGMISSTNINQLDHQAMHTLSCKDVMTNPLVTINSQTTAKKAKVLMKKHQINSVLVIDQNELVGILTTTDLNKFKL